ncbi:MAG: F0F1 ATP synthase subunit C [Alphaproteobacteria bacterium]|nr:F0F1 ATP synthase subunit C [Alphaproteobacteria bacterium]MBQ9738705.1 F0F1 ATP synthase subunit C [Alphaproteobacteria bacterium]MBR6675197.1 F0F1 ATP synthase subunit C [Alphaproteobacteria bacterium]
MDAETMKYLAIAIISLVMFGAAKGVAEIWTTTISSVSRNPNSKKDVSIFAWGGAALTEAIALYALGLAIVLLFS